MEVKRHFYLFFCNNGALLCHKSITEHVHFFIIYPQLLGELLLDRHNYDALHQQAGEPQDHDEQSS